MYAYIRKQKKTKQNKKTQNFYFSYNPCTRETVIYSVNCTQVRKDLTSAMSSTHTSVAHRK